MKDDKVVDVKEEHGKMTVTMKNGKKMEVNAKTVYTIWKSGRQDCAIIIEDSINSSSETKEK